VTCPVQSIFWVAGSRPGHESHPTSSRRSTPVNPLTVLGSLHFGLALHQLKRPPHLSRLHSAAHLQSDSRYRPTFDKRPQRTSSICSTVTPHRRLPKSPFCYLGFPLNTRDRPSSWFWLCNRTHSRLPLRPHCDLDTTSYNNKQPNHHYNYRAQDDPSRAPSSVFRHRIDT
jgi:hypothetical protein